MSEKVIECRLCRGATKQIETFSEFMNSRYIEDLAVYAESLHFIASPDLHPIVDYPYFLVYPKDHFTSFKLISTEWDKEMHEIVQYLKDLCQSESVIIFEHGQMTDGNKVKSIYHAHTHVIPVDCLNILSSVERSINDLGGLTTLINFDSFGTISSLNNQVDGDYLLFRQDDTGLFMHDDGNIKIQSQYFRILLQSILDPLSNFMNWKLMDRDMEYTFKSRLVNYPRRHE